NNVMYSRSCEVKPAQVEVQCKQAFLARQRVEIRVGPRAYMVRLGDDWSRPPKSCSTSGFDKGDAGFVLGNGIVCNDCGLINAGPGEEGGVSCEACGRTLCREHSWVW